MFKFFVNIFTMECNINMIEFLTVRDVKAPQREMGNAGIDFFIPAMNDQFKTDCIANGIMFNENNDIVVKAHGRVKIPSGLKAKIAVGMPMVSYGVDVCLTATNKSGVSTKLGLDVAAVLVDRSYQGEINISLTNTTNDDIILACGTKIVQFVPYLYLSDDVTVVHGDKITATEFYDGVVTSRGEKGFGNGTGNK